jgi:2,4-dienoyl-CoA reductase-like NADH-dependent reductase (Old Yellow Enzyme family)/thioredoxin reductase
MLLNIEENRSFSSLFQAGSIGSLHLDNRIIMAAMGNALADNDGNVTEAMLDYYKARARGGVGMVITQFVSVSRDDIMPGNPVLYNDSFIGSLSRLVKVIHEQGAKACVQIMHPGMLFLLLKSTPQNMTIKVPSITPMMGKERPYQVLGVDDIEKYIQDFVEASGRVKEAGADAVELHACHGCLLSTFLSPATNRRNDAYGGNIENRARFVRLIIEQIKIKVGKEFPLSVRINGCDDIEGGITPAEVVQQACILKAAGADAVSISSGMEFWSTLMAPSYLTQEGVILPVAAEVKKATDLPVIVSGKISPELAEKTIGSGQADFVAWGRPLLADPELPHKLSQGNFGNISRCIYCNNCLRTSWRSCTVNPFLYRESLSSMSPSISPRKIMVIGGGLAGMEAAVLCKMRGHTVSLFEKESDLGGQWGVACCVPGKEGYAAVVNSLKHSLSQLQVPVILDYEVTRDKVLALKPDVVIIATGAVPAGLALPGASLPNIFQANDVLKGKVNPGGKIVVIGGSMVAVETAVSLAEKGQEIALVSHSGLGGRKGPDDLITFRGLMRHMVHLRIPLYLNAVLIEFTGNSLILNLGGEVISLPVDTLILAVGVQPVDNLIGELKGIVPEIFPIGDCVMPGNAAQATYSAARVALKL